MLHDGEVAALVLDGRSLSPRQSDRLCTRHGRSVLGSAVPFPVKSFIVMVRTWSVAAAGIGASPGCA